MSEQRPADQHVSEADARKGDEQARERDPHGIGPPQPEAINQPAGHPTSDRHETETALTQKGNAPPT